MTFKPDNIANFIPYALLFPPSKNYNKNKKSIFLSNDLSFLTSQDKKKKQI